MNNDEKKMLEWVQFVTDKFSRNWEPWTYSRDTRILKHIRYESDSTGYEHWTKRVSRFLHDSTTNHFFPKGIYEVLELPEERSFISKIRRWPTMVKVHWDIQIKKDSNLPDGLVNNSIVTHWEEDGEYITMFSPHVGREVLKFLNAEPKNEYARNIINAMMETQKASWPSEEEGDNS